MRSTSAQSDRTLRVAPRLLHQGFFVLADQAIVSGVTFITGLLLLRLTDAKEYGAYVLAATALAVLSQAQSAALLGPVMILGAPQEEAEFRDFASGIGLVQVVLAAMAGLIGAVTAVCLGHAGVGENVRGAFIGAAAFAFWGMMQAYIRRVLIVRRHAGKALVNDAVFCILQVAGIGALAWGGAGRLTGRNVFYSGAAAGVVATVVGLVQVRKFLTLRPRRVARSLWDSWNLGRWTLASSCLMRASGQMTYLVLGAMAGEAAVASLEGPRLIVAPCLLAIMGWSNSVCPEASTRYVKQGMPAMAGFVVKAAAPLLAGLGAFVLVCVAFARPLLASVLGAQYAQQPWILAIWGATLLMMAASTVATMIIHSARRPQVIPLCALIAAAAGLAACPVLVGLWGPRGAAATSLIIETTAAAGTIFFVLRMLNPARRNAVEATALEAAA